MTFMRTTGGRLAVHSRQNIRLSSDVTNPLSRSWNSAGGWGRMLDLDLMPVSRLGKSAPTSICCGIRSLSPAAIGRCSVCARLTVLPFHPPGRNADPTP